MHGIEKHFKSKDLPWGKINVGKFEELLFLTNVGSVPASENVMRLTV